MGINPGRKGMWSLSGYKGVYRNQSKWQAKAKIDGKDKHLGIFSDAEEAAKHYDYYMLKHYGKGVFLNFPNFDYSSFVPASTRPRKKLTYHIAEEIRVKHHGGIEPKQLARDYRLSVTTVYKILNNLVYKPKDVAMVSVVYNPVSVCASGCRVVDPSAA